MKILATLEDYTSGKELKVAKILRDALYKVGVKAKVGVDPEKPMKRLIVQFEGDLLTALRALRDVPEVSKLIPIFFENLPPNIELASSYSVKALGHLIAMCGPGTFKVEVKKIDDALLPIKEGSLELCRIIGSEIASKLNLKVDVKNPDYIVYVQFSKSGLTIGASITRFYKKYRKHLPSGLFSKYVIIFEKPRTTYEIMDMLRLCAAMNVELRIVGARKDKVDKALNAIGGVAKQIKLKIYEQLDDAVRDVCVFGFSRSATLNEEDFLKAASSCVGRVGILIGNEYEGLSIEARHSAEKLFRLGPQTQFSMRSSTAAAYILGLLASLHLNLY